MLGVKITALCHSRPDFAPARYRVVGVNADQRYGSQNKWINRRGEGFTRSVAKGAYDRAFFSRAQYIVKRLAAYGVNSTCPALILKGFVATRDFVASDDLFGAQPFQIFSFSGFASTCHYVITQRGKHIDSKRRASTRTTRHKDRPVLWLDS